MFKKFLTALAVLVSVSLGACDEDSPTGSSGGGGVTVTLSSQALVAAGRAEGDLQLTRARFLLRDLKFHTPDGPEEMEFVTGPFVLELELDGTLNEVTAANVPADDYDEIRFKVHKLDDDDPRDVAAMQRPEFADFSGDDRLSVVIDGTYDGGSGPAAFRFESDLNEEQRSFLAPPISVSAEDTAVNVTLVIDTTKWFDGGIEGALDPRNPDNQDAIEDNISNSIDIFEDRDQDGDRDDS